MHYQKIKHADRKVKHKIWKPLVLWCNWYLGSIAVRMNPATTQRKLNLLMFDQWRYLIISYNKNLEAGSSRVCNSGSSISLGTQALSIFMFLILTFFSIGFYLMVIRWLIQLQISSLPTTMITEGINLQKKQNLPFWSLSLFIR